MRVASALGHGMIAGGLAAGLLVIAVVAKQRRLARLAAAALLAVVIAGAAANLMKLAVDSPRPRSSPSTASAGFPSGHTTVAFALAAVLGWAWPGVAPLLLLSALLTAVARVYLEAHFAVDVAGGAMLGALIGLCVARSMVDTAPGPGRTGAPRWLWALPIGFAALAAAFFIAYEHTIAIQRAELDRAARGRPEVAIPFGQPAAHAFLVSGWSVDEQWGGAMPFAWAEGMRADLRLPPLPAADYDLRLRLAPFMARHGLSCQRADLSVNGQRAGRLVLARGWHDYALPLPARLLRPGDNDLRLDFAYAMPAGKEDGRRLSVAFASIEARRRP